MHRLTPCWLGVMMCSPKKFPSEVSMKNVLASIALSLAFLPCVSFGQTYTFSTVVNFSSTGKGPSYPSNLIIDGNGNLYGTSYAGGAHGAGTVFRVSPAGVVNVVHSFAGSPSDGQSPYDAPVRDSAGNLYGTTYSGGSTNNCSGRPGCGTVFKVSPTAGETVLYNFSGGSDGSTPLGSLTLDPSGDLYGISEGSQLGVMFKISASGTFSTIYNFPQYPGPGATLIQNRVGNFFGTSYDGGSGAGSVFEISPLGQETTLYSFSGGADGSEPNTKLTQDSQENFYGTTFAGGANSAGTLYKIDKNKNFSVLYSFCQLANCADGELPYGWVTLDSAGNLYGLTFNESSSNPGLVFKLTPSGQESVLYSGFLSDWPDQGPALVMDKAGNLYGSTFTGGTSGVGTIFKLTRN